jgi:hypothetical protein
MAARAIFKLTFFGYIRSADGAGGGGAILAIGR